MQPLRHLLPILSIPPPSRDPRLPLVVPNFLSRRRGLDTFSAREAFPFSWGFGFGRGLGAGLLRVGIAGGSCERGPSGDERFGRLKSAPRRSWMPSRAVEWR